MVLLKTNNLGIVHDINSGQYMILTLFCAGFAVFNFICMFFYVNNVCFA